MSHIALIILDVIHATKGGQRSSCGRFPNRSSSPTNIKTYDDLPDEIVKINLINASPKEQVWQLFFDRASRTNPEGNIVVGVGEYLFSYIIT